MNKKASPVLLFFVILLGVVDLYMFLWPEIQATISTQWKPIIYLYPEEETDITVIVSNPENLTVTYPVYKNSWKVKAEPNGLLIDKTGRTYYGLYWEGQNHKKNPRKTDGFVVKGKDTTSFLEEKLEILGLNEREANEFIIYWLPILEKNKWNYIRFQTEEEINATMALEIDPKPDTIIRVMMEYKPLNKKIEVKEQTLKKVERKGFTVVEWGGTNIN